MLADRATDARRGGEHGNAASAESPSEQRGFGIEMDARQVIIEPVVSEKSYALMTDGKYTFRVDDRAHKTQIARAVEEIFDVRVAGVRTAKVRSKPKRRGAARRAHPVLEEGDRPAGARATGSSCSRAPRWRMTSDRDHS